MNDVLISGVKGFIGSHLLPRLQTAGFTTHCLTGDVTLGSTWDTAPACQTVIHLAARTFVPASWDNPAEYYHVNVVGTQRALDYCRRTGARLVLPSTYVYGQPQHLPVTEDHPIQPSNPYALSKWQAEELAAFTSREQQVPVSVLRLFNIYGPGQRADFLIPKIIRQVAEGVSITVADLEPRRDYVHIDDVCSAFLAACNSKSRYLCANICAGQSASVADVIQYLQQAAGTHLPVHNQGLRRPGEVMDVRGDPSLAWQLLGWQPNWPLADGLASTFSAVRRQLAPE